MSDALAKALADTDRSYFAAKASVASMTAALLTPGPYGTPFTTRPDLARAHEQLRHYCGWVYTAIRPIAQRIAGQKIYVGRKRTPGSKKEATPDALTSHPLLDLLANPNSLMVAWSLIYTTIVSLEFSGRALWWLPGKKQILPVPISWVVGFDGTTEFTAFRVRPPHVGAEFSLPAGECCYFAYPSPHDPHGATSPLQAAALAVDADENALISQASMFRRGIHPSHAVIVGKNPHPDVPGGLRPHLTAAQQRQIAEALRRRYADVINHGTPFILDGMIEDIKRISNTPAEMDWLNSGKAIKSRILQAFGTNPIIAGEVEGANRASSLAAEDHFCNYTIGPKIELLSQSMTEWLGPMFGNDIVIWIDKPVPRDDDNELRWAQILISGGAITGDELRTLSPFSLPTGGEFARPVAPSPAAAMGKAADDLSEAVDEMRGEAGLKWGGRLAAATRRLLEPIEMTNGEALR